MILQERVDVVLVDHRGALLPRRDEVAVDGEPDPGVEGHPVEDEVELGFGEEEEGEGRPVGEPFGEEGGVVGAEGFVGGEDWEEDGEDGAGGERDVVSCWASFVRGFVV